MSPSFSQILFAIAAVLVIVSCAGARKPVRQEVATRSGGNHQPTSILFIGNSYSFEIPKNLRRIAARHGKTLRVGQVTNRSWSLEQHAQNEETLRKIREGNWDVVVIQEQSRIPSQSIKRLHAMFPYVRELADEARAVGAVPVLYQTWGRRDGDEWYPGNDDFHAMNRRLREGYRHAAHLAGGLTVVPVGDAWEREVSAGRGARLFMPDGSHATGLGDELTAQVFFETLFAQGPR